MEIVRFMILCILGLGLFDATSDMIIDFKWKEVLKFLFIGALMVLIYKFL